MASDQLNQQRCVPLISRIADFKIVIMKTPLQHGAWTVQEDQLLGKYQVCSQSVTGRLNANGRRPTCHNITLNCRSMPYCEFEFVLLHRVWRASGVPSPSTRPFSAGCVSSSAKSLLDAIGPFVRGVCDPCAWRIC